MNRITQRLNALSRIVKLIKAYQRQEDKDRDVSDKQALDAYLNQHLSPQDWLFWQQIQSLEQ